MDHLDSVFEMNPPAVSFVAWLATRDREVMTHITKDYFSFKLAEERWLNKFGKKAVAGQDSKALPAYQRHETRYSRKVAVGLRYRRWLGTDGSSSKAQLRDRMN